jgi:hypothetical protein
MTFHYEHRQLPQQTVIVVISLREMFFPLAERAVYDEAAAGSSRAPFG